MKSKLGAVLAAAGCALALSVASAKAATITETINFTASGFQPPGAPVDPVMGSFTITLDPTVDTSFATTITFNNVNITLGASAPFFFYVANSSGGSLTVCSPAFPASCGETAGFNAFDVRMVNFQSTPLRPRPIIPATPTWPTENVGLELRNVVANYPFESSRGFPGSKPNSGHRDIRV
jgi:hypothetical protein